jgi:hypothetical protein
MEVVNLNDKLSKVKEHWSPKIVGELNDSYVNFPPRGLWRERACCPLRGAA